MDEGFSFGQPAKRRVKQGARRPARIGRSAVPLIVFLAIGLVLAGIAAFVVLRGAGEAGERVAAARSDTISTIDRANDAAAQATIGQAVVAARTAWADAGAFPTDPAALTALEPSATFTLGASTGPGVVSVSIDPSVFAAAVRSASGTCWWVKLDTAGITTYGSGGTCTGEAARAADAPSW
jgi:hypothetical protein